MQAKKAIEYGDSEEEGSELSKRMRALALMACAILRLRASKRIAAESTNLRPFSCLIEHTALQTERR